MQQLSKNQIVFRDMVLGVLVYAVVLGFFADYTTFVQTSSFSTTFLVAVTMQVLTYLTLLLKTKVITGLKHKYQVTHKAALGFVIWFIMFVSKFVFLAVIDVIFGESVEISGFIGLLLVIITVTLVTTGLQYIQQKLGQPQTQTNDLATKD